jgi:uncharacterized protein
MPNNSVIVNTSPLLYLYQVGYLDLLQQMYGLAITPNAVLEELKIGKKQGINVPNISEIPWIQIQYVNKLAIFPTVIDLGKGEAEVIALGIINPESLLILDDQLGRKIAKFYQLKYTGTLGILIKAKKLGYLTNIAPVIEKLKSQGMWLTDKIIKEILTLAEQI